MAKSITSRFIQFCCAEFDCIVGVLTVFTNMLADYSKFVLWNVRTNRK